jgi:hypothetical protein
MREVPAHPIQYARTPLLITSRLPAVATGPAPLSVLICATTCGDDAGAHRALPLVLGPRAAPSLSRRSVTRSGAWLSPWAWPGCEHVLVAAGFAGRR